VIDTLTSVLRDDPDWSALPEDLPAPLRRLIERCLRRDLRQRWRDAGDARIELADLLAAPTGTAASAPRTGGARAARRLLPWLVAALALAVAAALYALRPRAPAPAQVTRPLMLTLDLPDGLRLDEDYEACFALSPDASTLAFLALGPDGVRRVYVRTLNGLDARVVPGSDHAWQPFFSPDGRWIAFFADRKLQKAPVAGGAPVPIVEVGNNPRGATWSPDGTIVLAASHSSGLSRVPADGGALQELTRPDASRGERSHRWPYVLPDGSAVLFTADREGSTFDEAVIEAVSTDTRKRTVVWKGGAHARALPGGRMVFTRGGRLFAVRFDPRRLQTAGGAVPVLEGVRYEAGNGGTLMALAADGTLVYVPGLPTSYERHLAWVDRGGHRERLGGSARFFHEARLDPRGARVAVQVGPTDSGDVFVQDADRATLSQLTYGLRARRPVWSRDGRRIVVGAPAAEGWQLLSLPLPSGAPTVLYQGPRRLYPSDHSPDGRFLAFQELDRERGWEIRMLELDAAGRAVGAPTDFAATPAHEGNARFSHDGRWLAYESDELDGVFEVYAAPFGHVAQRQKVSRDSGRWPVWGGPGELLYVVALPSGLRHVSWRESAGAFVLRNDLLLAQGAALFSRPSTGMAPGAILGIDTGIDYTPARDRLLMLEEAQPDRPKPPYRMTLFVGWADEVDRLLNASR
jgi:serine/threonine-protein kinase